MSDLGIILIGCTFLAIVMICLSPSSEEMEDWKIEKKIDRDRFIKDHARLLIAIAESRQVEEFGAIGLRKRERIFEEALCSVSSKGSKKSLRNLRDECRKLAGELEAKSQ